MVPDKPQPMSQSIFLHEETLSLSSFGAMIFFPLIKNGYVKEERKATRCVLQREWKIWISITVFWKSYVQTTSRFVVNAQEDSTRESLLLSWNRKAKNQHPQKSEWNKNYRWITDLSCLCASYTVLSHSHLIEKKRQSTTGESNLRSHLNLWANLVIMAYFMAVLVCQLWYHDFPIVSCSFKTYVWINNNI